MGENNLTISIEGVSEVAIKLLDVIQKSVGWMITPRGERLDFQEALQLYKETVMKDEQLDDYTKAIKILNATRDLKKYLNQGKIIYHSLEDLDEKANPYEVDEDWLNCFFEYAQNVSSEEVQRIWGKLLALKVNGNNITKKLLNVFSLMEQKDIVLFCTLCALSFDNISEAGRQYPFVYIRQFPAYYNELGIRRYNLAQLDNLGLIEYDTHGNFVLPRTVPLLQYGKYIVKLEAENRVSNGNIRFTEIGRILYQITNVELFDDFMEHCKHYWDKMGIKYEIMEE